MNNAVRIVVGFCLVMDFLLLPTFPDTFLGAGGRITPGEGLIILCLSQMLSDEYD